MNALAPTDRIISQGRALSFDELAHYQKVVVALKETMRLMEEIDETIPQWPIE